MRLQKSEWILEREREHKEKWEKVKVDIPGFRSLRGFSDMQVTYCCSFAPTYFVEFPTIDYGTYFDARCVHIV